MKILISISSSKLPELNGVYLLRERKQFIRRGRTISKWETYEKPVKVVALRGQKVMIKNAFGNQTNTKAKGIDIASIGTGKQFKFLPFEKQTKEENTKTPINIINLVKFLKKNITGSSTVKGFQDGDKNDVIWVTHKTVGNAKTKEIKLSLIVDKSRITYSIATTATSKTGNIVNTTYVKSMYDTPKTKFAHKDDIKFATATLMKDKKVSGLLKKP